MHDIGACLLSTSANPNMLRLFGEVGKGRNGFEFEVKFKRVMVLSDFWYYALYSESASDMTGEHFDQHPHQTAKAKKLGLVTRYGDIGFPDGGSGPFLEGVLPLDVEAIMFPSFHDTDENAESEMAITSFGCARLLDAVTRIYVEDLPFRDPSGALDALRVRDVKADACVGENPESLVAIAERIIRRLEARR
jgi:hypothetical protein